jgi:pimeloyl-ACP methyl ester carboxylesterase
LPEIPLWEGGIGSVTGGSIMEIGMTGSTRIIARGDLRFQTESFGDPADPAVLMIMGATASMLWWPDELCRSIAGTGRFVVRYDNRDTGGTTTQEPGAPRYTIDDMAGDALAIMDGYGLARAHLVGMSLGGMIAQLVALERPKRVLSLTCISSSAFDEDDPELPGMDPALLAHFQRIATLDWNDRETVVGFHVESFRISAGPGAGFDEERARSLAEREYDRALNPQSAMNHSMLGGGEKWAGRLSELTIPSLVIHGRRDPILSFEHGLKLAAKLPSARLVELDAGHELNEKDWGRIVEEIRIRTA